MEDKRGRSNLQLNAVDMWTGAPGFEGGPVPEAHDPRVINAKCTGGFLQKAKISPKYYVVHVVHVIHVIHSRGTLMLYLEILTFERLALPSPVLVTHGSRKTPAPPHAKPCNALHLESIE